MFAKNEGACIKWRSERSIILLYVIRQLYVWAVVITTLSFLASKTAARMKFHLVRKFQTGTLSKMYYHTSWNDSSLFSLFIVTMSPLAMKVMDIGDIDTVAPTILILPLALGSILVKLKITPFNQRSCVF